jgi:hypothetical protein
MIPVLLLGLVCVLRLCAADDLFILPFFARVMPAGQAEPVPDPFLDSILNGSAPEPSQGVQVLPGKTYQISSSPKDFESEFDGIQGQRVVVSFTALVLPNGTYAVTDYRILGIAKGRLLPVLLLLQRANAESGTLNTNSAAAGGDPLPPAKLEKHDNSPPDTLVRVVDLAS